MAVVIYDTSVPVKCKNFHFIQIHNEDIGAKCYEFHNLGNSEEKIHAWEYNFQRNTGWNYSLGTPTTLYLSENSGLSQNQGEGRAPTHLGKFSYTKKNVINIYEKHPELKCY